MRSCHGTTDRMLFHEVGDGMIQYIEEDLYTEPVHWCETTDQNKDPAKQLGKMPTKIPSTPYTRVLRTGFDLLSNSGPRSVMIGTSVTNPTCKTTGASVRTFKMLLELETMPQTPIFPSMLGTSCSGHVHPDMEEKCGDPVYQDGSLVSGSLEVLIEHLVPTVDYYPDRTYIFTFLLSSRVFIHPQELLAKVGQICTKQLETGSEADKARVKEFVPKIIQLLSEWTETFPHDFQDEKSMKELKEITHQIAQCDEENSSVKKSISQMTQSLIRNLSAHSQYQEAREIIKPSVTDKQTILKPKTQSSQKDILSVCNDPCVLAQQLTHIEMDRLMHITPEELVHIFNHMDSMDNHKSCRSDIKKTYNLEACDNWFNRLSSLVATEICRVGKKKQRTRVVEFFIDVARECFNIGNFNSLMAIISGMNLSPVARLKKTWSKVKKAKFEVLENHMDPSSNFSHYRTALQGAVQRSQTAHSNREKVVIPVFNLFIKDIYFLNKIHANRLPNGQINFKKFWEIAKQISEFMMWKQVECPFEKDKKIKNYLLTAPVYTEEALYLASFESEGPENHMEKDSWKSLRATLLNRA